MPSHCRLTSFIVSSVSEDSSTTARVWTPRGGFLLVLLLRADALRSQNLLVASNHRRLSDKSHYHKIICCINIFFTSLVSPCAWEAECFPQNDLNVNDQVQGRIDRLVNLRINQSKTKKYLFLASPFCFCSLSLSAAMFHEVTKKNIKKNRPHVLFFNLILFSEP